MRILNTIKFTLIVFSLLSFQSQSQGARGRGASISGDNSVGLGMSIISSSQKDLNATIETANKTENGGPITSKQLSSAYEFYGQFIFRFSGSMFALVFRPSYFTQSSTGSGSSGSYDYKLNGFTFFPLLRVYPLESSFLKLFMHAGIGYGKLTTDVTTGTGNSVSFEGSNYGAMGGLGVDFCFTENHCMTIEGNVRYLPIERNFATAVQGTPVGFDPGVAVNREVELSNADLGTSMSGIQGILGYTYNF